MNCFAVDKSKDFESFIHNHNLIYPNKCKTLEGHEKENELFLVGKNKQLTQNYLFELMLLLGFSAIGYNGYYLLNYK